MGAAASDTRTMREFRMAEMVVEPTAPVFRETGAVDEVFPLRCTQRGGSAMAELATSFREEKEPLGIPFHCHPAVGSGAALLD